MSYSVDVNVLVCASDVSNPFYARAKDFLRACAERSEVFCLTWLTLMSYLRIATHPRIFDAPLSPDAAMSNVEALLSRPHVRLLAEDDGFWVAYREVADGLVVRGNLVPDAHLVAILRHHHVERLYTRDRDFRKFDLIRAVDPFE